MSAAVVVLSEFVARRRPRDLVAGSSTAVMRCGTVADVETAPIDFCFWQGASNQRYVHHVYSLIGCPQLPAANYILFARDANGHRTPLRVGRTTHGEPALNLAEIRHRGAKMGAVEVHVHLIAGDDAERRVIEMDLHAGLFGKPDMHPLSA
jgi:hypothetical protein